MATQVFHFGKQVQRQAHTVYTTLCGRSNRQSRDGMNIADTREQVTCKFCLRLLAKREV